LKRQQATEDAIAIGLRAVATGSRAGYLPPGPIFGMSVTSPDGEKSDEVATNNTKADYSSSASMSADESDESDRHSDGGDHKNREIIGEKLLVLLKGRKRIFISLCISKQYFI
jgi:hypothetical protein